MQKRQYLVAALAAIAAIALFRAKPVVAQSECSAAVFASDGKLELPKGYRTWVFVGGPVTPNSLNNGKARFPEFHNVYIQAQNVEAYLKNGLVP